MSMKLLLTHAYFLQEDPKELAIMRPYVPLGILSISAYLKKRRFPCTLYDTTFSTRAKFEAYLLEHKPSYIGIYVNLMTKLNVLKTIQFIRSQPELKKMKIILGGPEVRNHAEKFIEHGADYIVVGEGEETMYDLLTTIDTPMNPFLGHVKSIVFRNALGEITKTPERPKIKDINVLPLPDREGIDLQPYLDAWKENHGHSALSINTMRGCPYTCKWCSRAVYGLSYRRRSPKLVVDEIEQMVERYDPDTLWFVDDVFTVSHKWLREFADELKRRKVYVAYECITRADRMNEEVIDLLARTGCFRVWIGAESGSQKVIDLMDRRVEAGQVQAMIQLAQQKGIQAGTFIMLGYPGEKEADIYKTVEHLKAASPSLFTITLAYPITGTELHTEIEGQLMHPQPWESSTDRDKDFKRAYPRRYYDYAVRWVVNSVNLHKNQWNWEEPMRPLGYRARVAAARMGMWWWKRKGA